MRLILATILSILAFSAYAEEWKYKRYVSHSGGNYVDFTEHSDGKIYYSMNTNRYSGGSQGKLWIQSSDGINSSLVNPWNPISTAELAAYTDIWGQPMTYVRTTGIESYGGRCYLLMHVGATYGSSQGYYYIPAFADSDDCVNWVYHGPVSVNGVLAPYIFSSSSAYFIEDGVHYMAQDSGSYGDGSLVLYSSYDGMNYTQYSGDINYISEDRPVFPDMEACDGLYHMVYEEGWQNSYPLIIEIRHRISYMMDLQLWTMYEEIIDVEDMKGMNISCVGGELFGIRSRYLYKWE